MRSQSAIRGLLALTLLLIVPARNNAQDAKAVLTSAAKAMGMENLKTLEFSGMGSIGVLGQNRNPRTAWPLSRIKSYRRQIDLGARVSHVSLVRAQGNSEEKTSHHKQYGLGPTIVGRAL